MAITFSKALVIVGAVAVIPAASAAATPLEGAPPLTQFVLTSGPATPSPVGALDKATAFDRSPVELALAIALAAKSYPAVQVAKANERAAGAAVRGAKWQRFPSLSVEALGVGSGPGGSELAFTAEEPLWAGGRIKGTINLSKAQLAAATSAVAEVRLDTALQIAAAFFDIQRLSQREVILEESLAEHQKLVDSMARRVEVELSPASDLDLARSRAAQVEQELVLTNGQRRVALTRLREFTGDPAFQVTAIVRYDPARHHPDPDGLIDEALQFDPRRRKLSAESAAADASVDVARSGLFPQIYAQYQKPLYGDDRIGVVMRVQTDGGLSKFSAVDAARQRRASAEFAILTAERDLRRALEADLLENAVAQKRIASSSLSASSSQLVTESFMRQFVAGRRTWLDVMNAVRESATARLTEVEARVSAIASAMRLGLRSGRWRPQLESQDNDQ